MVRRLTSEGWKWSTNFNSRTKTDCSLNVPAKGRRVLSSRKSVRWYEDSGGEKVLGQDSTIWICLAQGFPAEESYLCASSWSWLGDKSEVETYGMYLGVEVLASSARSYIAVPRSRKLRCREVVLIHEQSLITKPKPTNLSTFTSSYPQHQPLCSKLHQQSGKTPTCLQLHSAVTKAYLDEQQNPNHTSSKVSEVTRSTVPR